MKTKLLSITTILVLTTALSHAQMWEQLAGEPEGGGITDIYFDQESGDLFVATGSLNWPSGEDGGIRRSSNDGASWDNIFDAYTSRLIMKGPDGHLYASVWEYPQDEGLYRSMDNGNSWEQLVSVPSGNNIFSCAIKEGSPNIIFAGTRQGVYRSFDNGVTWAYANDIIPGDAWVRSMAVGPDGTIAAGTSYGLYVSSDNGDSWDKVTGDGASDYIISVAFDEESGSGDQNPIINLLFGSTDGDLFLATSIALFTVAVHVATLGAKEMTRIRAHRVANLLPLFLVSLYASTTGNFFYALGAMASWQQFTTGLPPNPLISIFYSTVLIATVATIVVYLGMYGNSKSMTSGSEMYKATFDLTTGIELQPYANPYLKLFQNIPNPFKDQTRINFELTDGGPTSLLLYDMTGHKVRSLVNDNLTKGKHSILVEKAGLSSGIYYYRLNSNNQVQTKKLVIQ
ncbi:MAG: T9SS type A sorting domain-containing protein [Bacteroidetes bacterium]|nr:T9SS type A sorting domain-containing protein [Bacteroidota bacterium]